MATKDLYHDAVCHAVIKDGWTITHDPLYLDFDSARVQIDLAAEKLIAAQRGTQQIAIEVKSFLAASTIYEFHLAIGQCMSYRIALRAQEPERQLYLAVPSFTYEAFFNRPLAKETTQEAKIKLLIYDPEQEVIVQWIN